MKPAIVVLGSLNMDFVVRTEHLPAPGETVLGGGFQMIPGGKGANQACAAGRLASNALVRMIGRVGYDMFADHLKASLAAAGVDVSAVAAVRNEATGVALIGVDEAGQNAIIVAAGANGVFPPADVEGSRASFRNAKYALFQLETPLDTVAGGPAPCAAGRRQDNPRSCSRATAISRAVCLQVDILTPNESEARILLGRPAGRIALEEAPALAKDVLALGPAAVILKLGENGCLYADAESSYSRAGICSGCA